MDFRFDLFLSFFFFILVRRSREGFSEDTVGRKRHSKQTGQLKPPTSKSLLFAQTETHTHIYVSLHVYTLGLTCSFIDKNRFIYSTTVKLILGGQTGELPRQTTKKQKTQKRGEPTNFLSALSCSLLSPGSSVSCRYRLLRVFTAPTPAASSSPPTFSWTPPALLPSSSVHPLGPFEETTLGP